VTPTTCPQSAQVATIGLALLSAASFCFAVANALVYLATMGDERYNTLVDPSRCPLINVGTGEDLTIRALAETVAAGVGYTGKFAQDTSKPDGTMRKVMDVEKLSELGWTPATKLSDGLDLTYKNFLEST